MSFSTERVRRYSRGASIRTTAAQQPSREPLPEVDRDAPEAFRSRGTAETKD
jgi:hypothetical protein